MTIADKTRLSVVNNKNNDRSFFPQKSSNTLFFGPAILQPKLQIGQPDDPFEKEADAVADRVMRMPLSDSLQTKSDSPWSDIPMKCAQCEEEEKLQMKAEVNSENILQMKLGDSETMAFEGLSSRLISSKGSGQPLPERVKGEMGAKIGADFSGVKVHTGYHAVQMSREIGARAFTYGSNIYFNQGEYIPQSSRGKHLLAHELTHVVQQNRLGGSDESLKNTIQRFPACRYILDANETEEVSESRIRDELHPFIRNQGPTVRELPIPDGNFNPYRNRDIRDPVGYADIAHVNGNTLEILELKKGTWVETIDAEVQMNNYVNKAQDNIQEVNNANTWLINGYGNINISSVRPMPLERFEMPNHIRLSGVNTPISTAFCTAGVAVFKAIGSADKEIFDCSLNLTQNTFYDNAIGVLNNTVDQILDQQILPTLHGVVRSVPLERAINYLINSPITAQYLGPIVGYIPNSQLASYVAGLVRDFGEEHVRLLVLRLVDRVMVEIRTQIKGMLGNWLDITLNSLCATAAYWTLSELLELFRNDFNSLFQRAMIPAMELVMQQVMAEIFAVIVEAVAYAVAAIIIAVIAVLAAIALWKIAAVVAAAISIEAILATGMAALRALIPQLPRLLPV